MKLTRNILWNTAGIGIPLVVGIVVVPLIIRGLGTERFGFLSVIWMLIGYFGLFDLGLSRSLTKLAADRLGTQSESEIPALASTALTAVIACSAVFGLATALSSAWLVTHLFHGSPQFAPEATSAIRWLCVGLPFVLGGAVLTGLLESHQKFALINAVRLPVGVLLLVAPLLVMPYDKHLGAITAALSLVRALGAVAIGALSLHVVPGLRRELFTFRRELVKPLLTYGGWLSVSNLVGPLMVYFDRFLIAALLGATAVAYYTVPYDVLNRLLVLPTAMQGVLFPAFAMMRSQNSPRAAALFERSSTTTMLMMLPPLLAVMLFASQGLELWVGGSFARHGAVTAQILVVGVVANALARTPYVFVQGAGYAKWTAVLHLVELPCYAALLVVLLEARGIEGAALAWSCRTVVDAVALYAMTVRLEPVIARAVFRDLLGFAGACAGAVVLDWVLRMPSVRMTVTAAVSLACAVGLLSRLRGAVPASLKHSA